MTELEEFLKNIEVVVEATAFEKHILWEKYHERFPWEYNAVGYIRPVKNGPRPICISLTKAVVDGIHLLFWHPTSVLVDYDVIEKWFKKNLPPTAFIDGEIRHVDANNFINFKRE